MTVRMLATLQPGTMLLDVQIPNTRDGGFHPHLVDIYVPKPLPNGSPGYTRALISLHGGTGDKLSHALQMNVRKSTVSAPSSVVWKLLEFWHFIAVFPQGQACTGITNAFNPNGVDTRSSTYPNGVATWSSGFMYSQADDVQFLKDLKTYLAVTFSGLSGISINGHSAGGFMVKKMWYDSPITFTHYSTISGPAAITYLNTAAPTLLRPMLAIDGRRDTTVGILDWADGVTDHLFDVDGTWDNNPANKSQADVAFPADNHNESDWHVLVKRAAAVGFSAIPSGGVTTPAQGSGTVTEFSYDGGNQSMLVFSDMAHDMGTLRSASGAHPFTIITNWIVQT